MTLKRPWNDLRMRFNFDLTTKNVQTSSSISWRCLKSDFDPTISSFDFQLAFLDALDNVRFNPLPPGNFWPTIFDADPDNSDMLFLRTVIFSDILSWICDISGKLDSFVFNSDIFPVRIWSRWSIFSLFFGTAYGWQVFHIFKMRTTFYFS